MASLTYCFRSCQRDEAGFTLTELLTTLVLGLIVLGVSYMLMFAGNGGSRTATDLSSNDRSVGQSMDDMTRLIRESQRRLHAEDYFLEITADPNNDGILEDVQYRLGTDGKLWRKVQNQAQTVTLSNAVVAMDLNNLNVQPPQPLFLYYISKSPTGNPSLDVTATPDSAYNPPKDGDRLTKCAIITINPIAASDPSAAQAYFNVKTDIFLRNASPGT